MPTRHVTLSQFHRKVLALVPELEGAVVRGLQSAALRLQGFVVEEIDTASPHPAVDRGELRMSVGHEMFDDGAEVSVSAPHAAALEEGSRPHWPPLEPLIGWVRRKGLADDEDEVEQVARNIQRHIATFGTEPRFYFKKAWDRVQPVIGQEINQELVALAAKS